MGSDVDTTNGAEASHMRAESGDLSFNRGYEWWLLREAKARNPSLVTYALPWGWPAWVGGGSDGSPWTNVTRPVEYMLSFLRGARDVHNISMDYVGLWNEKGFTTDYIVALRAALNAEGFAGMGIVASDQGGWPAAPVALQNATVRAALRALGSHYPGSSSSSEAVATGLPLFASEDNSQGATGNGAACWGRVLNENYVHGLMTGSISWSLICSWYDPIEFFGDGLMVAATPWAGYYDLHSMAPIWSSAHYAQATAPGWTYLRHGSGVGYLANGGTYTTLLAPGGGAFTLLVEKLERKASGCSWSGNPPNVTTPENATFVLGGTLAALAAARGSLSVWRSSFNGGSANPADMFAESSVAVDASGAFTLPVAVGDLITVTTLATLRKGAHPAPPPLTPFPLPLKQSFDNAPLEGPGQYWSDLNGAFEVVPDVDPGHGRVLQQVTPAKPILWLRDDTRPHTVLGDPKAWANVTITADFKLGGAGQAAALGVRCSPRGGMSQQTDTLAGLWVVVDDAGAWNVTYAIGDVGDPTRTVASGTLPAPPGVGAWHTLSVGVAAGPPAVLRASLDGAPVAGLDGFAFNTSAVPPAGWVALGTANYGDMTSFDNIVVEPTPA